MSFYCDHTSFEPADDPWNGWVKDANGQALELDEEDGNYYAYFDGMSGNLMGTVLKKSFTKLTIGKKYRISIRVKRAMGGTRIPSIRWFSDLGPVSAQEQLTNPQWQVIRTDFTPSKTSHTLSLNGSESIGTGDHADFWIDDIRIYPLQLQEDFSTSLDAVIEPGEQLDQHSMVISLPSSSKNKVSIQAHPLEETETQKGKGLAFNQNVPLDQPEQEVTLQLKGEYNKVDFTWSWISLPGTVTFYGPDKELLGQHSVDPSAGRHQNVSFKAGSDKYVTELLVSARDFSYLDFFKFEPELVTQKQPQVLECDHTPGESAMSLYSDYTSFERPGDWNGWAKDSNGQTLEIRKDPYNAGNHIAYFQNLKVRLNGRVLTKAFDNLTPKQEYRVSIRVRRARGGPIIPTIYWELDGTLQGEKTELIKLEWEVIRTGFIATKNSHKLTLVGKDSPTGATNPGDFWLDDIRIYPVTMDEDFDDSPGGIVKPGEALDQGALIISLPPSSTNNVGIQAHPMKETDTQKGKGLAFNQNVPLDQPEQEVTLKLKGEYNKVEFTWSWISQPGTVTFYGPGKELLGQQTVSPSAGAHQEVSFKAGANNYVTEIVVSARDFSYLDFFNFESE